MAKVAVFTPPARAHLNPSAAIVRELVSRGEEIVYYTAEEFREEVEGAGARLCAHSDYGLFNRAFSKNEFEIAAQLVQVAEQLMSDLLERVRQEQPDYIIHDSYCPWGKPIGQLLGVPAIASVHGFALNDAFFKALAKPNLTALNKVVTSAPAVLKLYVRSARFRRKYRLPPAGLVEMLASPEPLNIVYTSRLFHPVADTFDGRYIFVGPTIAPRPPVAFPNELLQARSTPLVYIALGTIYNNNPRFYKACLKAFGNAPYRVVLSVGPGVDPEAFGSPPDNFIVRQFVPQLRVLEEADVFISHGGMKSVNEAFYYGVPLVVVPQGVDQTLIGQRVAELGAGVLLRSRGLTPRTLLGAVEQVLSNPTFKEKSVQLGVSMKESGGYLRAVDEILAYREQLGLA